MLQIHRQKFDPAGRYVLARAMLVGGKNYEAGEVVPFPTADVSLEAARCMWKERILVPAPVEDPVATATAAGAGSPSGGGPPRPAAPLQARRGR